MVKWAKPTVTAAPQAATNSGRLSLWFFGRPRRALLLWLVIVVFGAMCYTTLLKREGFPSVATPFAIASGSYLVHDPAKVDRDVAKPLSDFLLKQSGVKTVQTQSSANFYTAMVAYQDGVDAKSRSQALSQAVSERHLLPAHATLKLSPYEFGFTQRGDDLVVSFYNPPGSANTEELVSQATKAAAFIKARQLPLVKNVSVIDPFEQATNPQTGQTENNQKTFDRFGQRQANTTQFYTSVVIGVKAQPGADNLKLDKQISSAVSALNQQPQFKNYHAVISASYAPQIKQQINELQTALLEGLIAVLIVGSIVIAVPASLVTVLSMLTVLATVNGLLYLIGYSLNTITLFALILGLSLIVDDTIIMVEALDAQRRRQNNPELAVREATRKVTRAMVAATTTAALSFAPFLFVGGVLGSFIRAIPITIITALLTSLLVALIFIPIFARYLLFSKKQMGQVNVHEPAARLEARIAGLIAAPMLWAKGSSKKLVSVGLIAVIIGLGFIGAGGYLFQKVTFNIFPPAKDGDQLSATITYPADTSIQGAQTIANQVDQRITQTLGRNFVKASYYDQADMQTATLTIDIIDYKQRAVTAPQLVQQLNDSFSHYAAAKVKAASLGVGPPTAVFTIQIKSAQNRTAALHLAGDMASYLKHDAVLKRPSGTIAKVDSVSVGNSNVYIRSGGTAYVTVNTTFVDTDTTTLVTLAQHAVTKHFTASKVASYGLSRNAISFNTGQEQENQKSFKTLAKALPVLLLVIYLVLAFQFRSLLQPLLIFMALPFSLFGITLGLYLTNNAFSFFSMLGFFALIGLSIKNTILLTDFANQARKAGAGTVDAAHQALAERFRPLVATSLTAVFSLLPLTISSPFWQGLGVVLICGLLSSTFLVLTVFPYYYLGAEYLRQHINRRTGLGWFVLTLIMMTALVQAGPKLIPLAPFVAVLIIKLVNVFFRDQRARA